MLGCFLPLKWSGDRVLPIKWSKDRVKIRARGLKESGREINSMMTP